MSGAKERKVAFTPTTTGKLILRILEAGADNDYDVAIASSDAGIVENGGVIIDVNAGRRSTLNIELEEEFSGAVKVVAYEI